MNTLLNIQSELKAPKNQYNSFGKYKYRSCEDILEALKPLLVKNQASMTISDDMVCVGDKNYIKATVTLQKGDETYTATALAREAVTKKGMDDSQITGTASSYARKYALNGLFLIDDTKDTDTDEYKKEVKNKEAKVIPQEIKSIKTVEELQTYWKGLTEQQRKDQATAVTARKKEITG